MKLIEYFKAFLENEVNLNQSRIDLLDERVAAITNFLKGSELLRDNFIDTIPQGSYAHKTIIKPARSDKEFDADLLLHLEEFEDWTAADYVQNVYSVFRGSATYRDMVSRKTRCVVVNYAGDFHIDVVPYLERHGSFYITNRHEDLFELTNPEGYNAWLEEKNRTAEGHLLKVIRLIKYLRDYKGTFAVKSIILNTFLGDRVNDAELSADDKAYADVPTVLKTVMGRLNEYLQENPMLPVIEDPSGTKEHFNDRWDQDGYTNFRKWIKHYSEKIEDAYLETDKDKSIEKWQVVFGDKFVAPKQEQAQNEKAALSSVAAGQDTEQFLERDFGIPVQLNRNYKMRINGRVLKKDGFRTYDLKARGNRVEKNRYIRFTIERCDIPSPYTIKWKVKNRGFEARNCLRGQINDGTAQWYQDEATAFRGEHYVECYIIKNGICVAKDRQPVIVQ